MPKLPPHKDGHCDRCGKKLEGRRKRWCSDECSAWAWGEFSRQHDWNSARQAALARDGHKCVRCGSDGSPPKDEWDKLPKRPRLPENWRDMPEEAHKEHHRLCRAAEKAENGLVARFQLEVNHIVPRNGGGYGRGCHHHLDNLETLCAPCHDLVTSEQVRRRKIASEGSTP